MAHILATDMSISVYDSNVVCKVFIIPSSETGVVNRRQLRESLLVGHRQAHAPSDWLPAVHRGSEWSLSRLQLLLA